MWSGKKGDSEVDGEFKRGEFHDGSVNEGTGDEENVFCASEEGGSG